MPQGSILSSRGFDTAQATTSISGTSWVKVGAFIYDHEGNCQEFDGKDILNAFKDVSTKIEKSALIILKNRGELSGKLRATRAGQKTIEWDHVVISFSIEESVALSEDVVSAYREVVVEALGRDVLGETNGRRLVVATGLHQDKGENHLHFMVHRIPVDWKGGKIGKSFDLARGSELSAQKQLLNDLLVAKGLAPLNDQWESTNHRGETIVHGADRNEPPIADNVKELVNRDIEEEGGEVSLNLQPEATLEGNKEKRKESPALSTVKPNLNKIKNGIRAQEQVISESAKTLSLLQMAVVAIEGQNELEEAVMGSEKAKAEALENVKKLSGDLEKSTKDLNEISDVLRGVAGHIIDSKLVDEEIVKTTPLPSIVDRIVSQTAEARTALQPHLPQDMIDLTVEKQADWVSNNLNATTEDLIKTKDELAGAKDGWNESNRVLLNKKVELKSTKKTLAVLETKVGEFEILNANLEKTLEVAQKTTETQTRTITELEKREVLLKESLELEVTHAEGLSDTITQLQEQLSKLREKSEGKIEALHEKVNILIEKNAVLAIKVATGTAPGPDASTKPSLESFFGGEGDQSEADQIKAIVDEQDKVAKETPKAKKTPKPGKN